MNSCGYRILAKGQTISNDTWATGLNNNDMIIGPSGSGKTRGYVKPNLLQMNGSMIVTDTKGLLRREVGPVLERHGYQVAELNLADPLASPWGYNPLAYIRFDARRDCCQEQDILTAAAALVPIEDDQQPFWEMFSRNFLEGMISYVLECLPEEEHNMIYVTRLFSEMASGNFDKLFRELCQIAPTSFAAMRYKMTQSCRQAEKMYSSVQGILAEKLAPFAFEGTQSLFRNPMQIDLCRMTREKTAVFLTVSDTDPSNYRLANLFYTQALHTLCGLADQAPGGRLELPVRFFLDDFASNVCIPDFDRIISIIRSREISVSILIQSLSQLEALYGRPKAMTILDNCDNLIYLGGQNSETAQFIAEKADRRASSILQMPMDAAWLFTRGAAPVQAGKYRLEDHPRYQELPEFAAARRETEPSTARDPPPEENKPPENAHNAHMIEKERCMMTPDERRAFMDRLLDFDNIVIQCHDNPDPDTVASGWALWNYFHDHGKQVRLVYSGQNPIQKANLVMMIRLLDIKIDYVQEIPEPGLLLTVDCQYGCRNVFPLAGQNIAVIDHHRRDSLLAAPDPSLCVVQDGYGACSTIVWQLMGEAGYSVTGRPALATALYYGLYMDTGMLQELRNAYDRNMRNQLETVCDETVLTVLKYNNLSLDELRIAGHALSGGYYNPEYRFAVAEAQSCDSNILGIVSDNLISVDAVDACVAYCVQPDKVRVSVRTYQEGIDAPALVRYLTHKLGEGGGHKNKAAGSMDTPRLAGFFEKRLGTLAPAGLSALTHRLLETRMEDFFREEVVCRYGTEEVPDLRGEPVFEKRSSLDVGYVLLKDLCPVGTRVTVRELERDQHITVKEDSILVLLADGTVQHDHEGYFWERHREGSGSYQFPGSFQPLLLEGDGEQQDKEEPKSLVSLARPAVNEGYDTVRVHARQLTQRAKVFLPWSDRPLRGERGDWLAANVNSPQCVFIIERTRFATSYLLVEEKEAVSFS